jgi:hypothetical protein
MLDSRVDAGQTLLRALKSRASVDTRYGGRFVEAIDGVEGSLAKRHDWFWFVNGVAGDRSAAEYRLQPGDVAWWDYRDWTGDADLAVVVGAFPEPLLHGFGGRRRPSAVVYQGAALHADAARISRFVHAQGLYLRESAVPGAWNVVRLSRGPERFTVRQRSPGSPDAPVVFSFSGDVGKLLAGAYRRRFAVP